MPDIGITLVELLAYVGDYLSYYQDAVATEAYLETARQRISVRRHARLVDYVFSEGCNARAWVCVGTAANSTLRSAPSRRSSPGPTTPSAAQPSHSDEWDDCADDSCERLRGISSPLTDGAARPSTSAPLTTRSTSTRGVRGSAA